ncbi:MAG: phosphatase PAP2 family protein [Acidobacteria bacterium]|nr:phosphatase PAP2 family protein [Acidobacteriota bacterium]
MRQSGSGRSKAGRIRTALIALGLAAIGIVIEIAFLRTAWGQRLDASTFGAVVPLREMLGVWADRSRLVLPALAAALASIALIFALVRGRWRSTIAPVVLVVLTLVICTVLKDFVVVRPYFGDFGYPQNTFPSGHTAVTVAALVALYWLLPRPHLLATVPLILLGSATALFQVASYAHRLSDVIGGALLVGLLAVFFVGPIGTLRASRRWLLWTAVLATAVVGALCLMSWEASGYNPSQQWTATAGIALTAGAGVSAALAVAAERPTRQRER